MKNQNPTAPSPFSLLLPYQRAWVADPSRFKIWLKSRQVGGSLAAAFEIVADALQRGADWIVLSAGERQALEFMEKVHRAGAIFCQAIAFEQGRPYVPETKASQIRFPNGARILALPANASTARGYSANLVLDEFAFHENPEEIWRAVYPIITNPLRGQLRLRVISTPAGMNNKFYDLWSEAPDFSRHKVTVYDAVEQGLPLDIEELKANLADPDGWAQEFECQFMEHAAQVFPMDLIRACEDSKASKSWSDLEGLLARTAPGAYPRPITPNPLFIGIDVGRRKDLTVAWTLERLPSGRAESNQGTFLTREVLVLESMPFPEQEEILLPRIQMARSVAIDATGIGGPVSEHLAKMLGAFDSGSTKLQAVTFTNERKRELFSRAKKAFQARMLQIPPDPTLRDDLARIQRIVTPQGLVKFIAARTADGHADRATALALALHAGYQAPPVEAPLLHSHLQQGRGPARRRPQRTRYRRGWTS